jgi:hypothetical protein
MQAAKPNFTDSELMLIESSVNEDLKRWIDNFEGSSDFEEVKNEYVSILEKLKNWRREENNWYKAIDSLVTNQIIKNNE